MTYDNRLPNTRKHSHMYDSDTVIYEVSCYN